MGPYLLLKSILSTFTKRRALFPAFALPLEPGRPNEMAARNYPNNYRAQLVALLLCCLIAVTAARQAPAISTGDAAPAMDGAGDPVPDPDTSDAECARKKCGSMCNTPCPPGMTCPTVMGYCQPDGSCTNNAEPSCTEAQAKIFMEGLAKATGHDVDYVKEKTVRQGIEDPVHDGDIENLEYVCKNITAEEAETLSKDAEEPVVAGTEICEMQPKMGEGGRFLNIDFDDILDTIGKVIGPPGKDLGCKASCTAKATGTMVKCTSSAMTLSSCIPAIKDSIDQCSQCPSTLCHAPPIQTATTLMCKSMGCYQLPGALQGACNEICNFCSMPSTKPPSDAGGEDYCEGPDMIKNEAA